MRAPLRGLSVRQKMVLPAVVGLVATLAATGVTLEISRRAAARLDRVERTDFPALQLAQDLEFRLQELQRQLQDAASAEDGSALDVADGMRDELVARLDADGARLLGADREAALRGAVEGYYALARATTWRLIRQESGEGLVDDLRAMTARYKLLREELAADTARARAATKEGFEEARGRQRTSILAGAVFLLSAAVAAAAVAWWLAARTARPLQALNAVALRIAEGDLTHPIEVDSGDEIGALAASFGTMVARLREIVGTLKGSAQDLAGAAQRLSDVTQTQSASVEQQAAGVAETSTTTRELEQTSSVAASRAASVLDVARRAADMSEAGQSAAERSVEGIRQIQSSVESIVGQSTRLLDQARQVGDIVETVRDLATQSHVLSLNASIEAARAGEAGRGFAVVAAEVRALAEQSGQSAARIGRIVQDILGAIQTTLEMTEKGNRGMEGSIAQIRASGDSLRDIGGIVRETSDAAMQIASAVQQQSAGIGQIATAMRHIDKGMEESVSRIQTLEDSALQVAETATRISNIANGFQV
jgi:methyl-accepting chemotaxis protein